MASQRGSNNIYQEMDRVDEKLVNELKSWIMYDRLEMLARHLCFTQAQISTIMTDTTSPERQIFKVNNSQFLCLLN